MQPIYASLTFAKHLLQFDFLKTQLYLVCVTVFLPSLGLVDMFSCLFIWQ